MVQILLEGHEIKHDLVELIRIFFPKDEIIYIDNQDDYSGEGILVINTLSRKVGEIYAKTQLYIDNLLVNQSIEDINSIEVFANSKDKNIKIGIKKSLYECLISISENKIPWGILTGIRPVKIVHDLLDKNIDTDEITKVLVNEYKINVNKTKLIMDIGKTAKGLYIPYR